MLRTAKDRAASHGEADHGRAGGYHNSFAFDATGARVARTEKQIGKVTAPQSQEEIVEVTVHQVMNDIEARASHGGANREPSPPTKFWML